MHMDAEATARVRRYQIENKKLTRTACSVAAICPAIERFEIDSRVLALISKTAFASYDLVGLKVRTKMATFTVILVPLRLWYRPMWHRRAIEFRDYMRGQGIRCLVAPASAATKQPRLRNAQLVAACSGLSVRLTDQVTVVSRALQTGGLTLQDAASLIDNSDPAGAVLSMVSRRLLCLPADKPIGPQTVLFALV
ncbi:hypothetical protein ABIB57_001953 [Devosia sp. UYZn731]